MDICETCNGSGEGLNDFSKCCDCKGSGEVAECDVTWEDFHEK